MKTLPNDPPWLKLALSELGVAEVAGPKSNPRVLAYFADAGRPDIKDDAVAWCAAVMGSWLVRTGHQIPAPAKALLARTYCNYGVKTAPKRGAIGVWPRGKAPYGHVAIVLEVDAKRGVLTRISGNLRNAVTIDDAPISTALAFRWPVEVTYVGK